MRRFIVVAAALAYLAGACESRNLWDYLNRPLVSFYALAWLSRACDIALGQGHRNGRLNESCPPRQFAPQFVPSRRAPGRRSSRRHPRDLKNLLGMGLAYGERRRSKLGFQGVEIEHRRPAIAADAPKRRRIGRYYLDSRLDPTQQHQGEDRSCVGS